jgi:hypothetical protein
MILVDTALRQRASEGRSVRVGMYGAGAMARGFVAQVTALVPGMEVVAIANRTLQRAADAYAFAGRDEAVAVSNLADLDRAIAAGTFSPIRRIATRPERHADAETMAVWIDADQRFHEVLFEAARNRWLSKIAADIKLLAHGFTPQRRMPEFLTVPVAVQTCRGHRRLVRSLATRDADLAAATALAHIRQGKEEVFAHLAAQGFAGDLDRPRPIQRRGRPRGSTSRVSSDRGGAGRRKARSRA